MEDKHWCRIWGNVRNKGICSIFLNLFSDRVGFFQIPCRADDLRIMCCKRARRLNSDSGRNTGHKNAFALQIDRS
jgi:hypothetical protein